MGGHVTEWHTVRVTVPASGTETKVTIPSRGWRGLSMQHLGTGQVAFVATSPGLAKAGLGIAVYPPPTPPTRVKHYAVVRDEQSLYVSSDGAGGFDLLITIFR